MCVCMYCVCIPSAPISKIARPVFIMTNICLFSLLSLFVKTFHVYFDYMHKSQYLLRT